MTQGDLERLSGVREGDVLAGKYRVERVLGVGGMGAVVAAYHMQLETKVALKFLLPAMLVNEEAVTRFAREARAAVKITNEHVARVLDVGTLESGAPYIVMEYLDGSDLAGWLRQRGPLPIEEAIDFVLQAGEALAEAHALGIVHRDLKPANLFCIRSADGRPTIKVLDFGISKVMSPSGSASNMGLTRTSALMGSPFYMSPEQMEATHSVDARTDLWALGVILHEILTGTVPFSGETVTEVAMKIGRREPPRLRAARPDAPGGLEAVILRCLEKDRDRRYRNVAELALALLPFAPKRAKGSVEKIVAIVQSAGPSDRTQSAQTSLDTTDPPMSPETMAPLGRTATASKAGKARVGVFAGIGTLVLVGGIVVAREWGRGPHADGGAPSFVAASSSVPLATTTEPSATLAAAPPPLPSSTVVLEPPAPPAAQRTPSATGSPVHASTSSPPHAPPAARTPTPKPDCDPPFTLDDKGQKHFKPECYR